jgi:hypothetical protein
MHSTLTVIPGRPMPREDWFDSYHEASKHARQQASFGYLAFVLRWLDDGGLELLEEWSQATKH